MAEIDPSASDGDRQQIAASRWVEDVLRTAPSDGMTVEWLLAHLLDRSTELLFLILTPIAVVPATSTLAGAVLLIIAVPLAFHGRGLLPGRLSAWQGFPSVGIERGLKGLLPVLKCYEAYALRHPHRPARNHTKLVGVLVTMLSVILLIPLPLSNVVPGLTLGTIAIASLEQDDKLLLLASFLTGFSLLLVLLEVFWAYHLTAALL